MIIPYRVDVPVQRRPIANWVIIAVTIAAFFASLSLPPEERFEMALGRSVGSWLFHAFLHIGIIHLVGNMLFLWIFGNAICAKVGNIFYPFLYLFFALAAGGIHMTFDGDPAIGASGVINGIVGMFLLWYPLNDISCLWVIFIYHARAFTISSAWMILFWLAFDIWGAASHAGGVAYWAHLGGFASGAIVAALLLVTNRVRMADYEKSLLAVLGLRET